VLDLGCGDGKTALPAAKLGVDVLDIARNLVEAGNNCARERGVTNLRVAHSEDKRTTTMDTRETRELTIALTAVVVAWSIAAALTFAAQLLFGYEAQPFDGPTALIGDWLALEGVSQ
jgi:hypothetical protein